MYERTVTLSGVTAVQGKSLVGINSNYGDTATITVCYSLLSLYTLTVSRTPALPMSRISVLSMKATRLERSQVRLDLVQAMLANTPSLCPSAELLLISSGLSELIDGIAFLFRICIYSETVSIVYMNVEHT